MITYTEKGAGLHDAIRAAGYTLRRENGVWISSNDTAVQAIIDGYALTDAAQWKSDQIDAYAKQLRDRALKAVSAGEMGMWATKYQEAKAFQASGLSSDAPNLSVEAQQRGVTLSALCTRVLSNFSTIATREAKIAGTAGKHKDAVKALSTFAAIATYDYSAGWP
jgi:hypothetical protein